MFKSDRIRKGITRVARRLSLVAVAALLVIAGGIHSADAPEDPWRFVVEVPGTPTPLDVTSDLLDRFLESHKVALRPGLHKAIAEAVTEESLRHDMEPRLILSVILSESSFRTDAVSRVGAVGLMQLLPSTAAALANEMDLPWEGKSHLKDPQVNIAMGAYYLDRLIDRYEGDLDLALTAYNMGPSNLKNLLARGYKRGIVSGFTSTYAKRIVTRMDVPEPATAQAL